MQGLYLRQDTTVYRVLYLAGASQTPLDESSNESRTHASDDGKYALLKKLCCDTGRITDNTADSTANTHTDLSRHSQMEMVVPRQSSPPPSPIWMLITTQHLSLAGQISTR
jgi:hypothetical protein